MGVGEPLSLICGIDPGLGGAIAYFEPDSKKIHSIHDMPTFEIEGKRQVDVVTLADLLACHASVTLKVVVEKVGAMPGNGVTSMFNFGYSCGQIHGILAALKLPTHFVRPQVWKALFGLSQSKDASRQRVIDTFPSQSELFSRKKDDGRAEALLLAIFGCRLT